MKNKLISDWLLCGLRLSGGSFRLTFLDGGKEEAVASWNWNGRDKGQKAAKRHHIINEEAEEKELKIK